ncbi:MAG: hypothetical protein ABI024_04855 [Vicinamibacterales bacterium]
MSTASLTSVSTASRHNHTLPFRGSLTAKEIDIVTFPTLLADGEAEGTATHLGRYAATFNATVSVLDGRSTGSYTFTAANGDQLFSTFTGLGVPAGGALANITETLRITGGTGRFAGASGTLEVHRTLDQSTGASSGSIQGSITMQQ